MAKRHLAMQMLGALLALMIGGGSAAAPAPAEPPAEQAGAAPARAASAPQRRWLSGVPRVTGRVLPSRIGLVINDADPYSVEVGEHYRRAHALADEQVLHVDLPVQPHLAVAELERLRRRIDEFFGDRVQGLALAWVKPFAVECQSITSAVTLGFDPGVCTSTCARQTLSPYFNSRSAAPWRDHGLRPSMLLAASSPALARRLIDRASTSIGALALRGVAPSRVHYMNTADAARNVRASLFPPAGAVPRLGLEVLVEDGDLPAAGSERVVLVQTGVARFSGAEAIGWLPGALADHLTSYGGVLDRSAGQSTVLDWIDAGVTASYGTVSEPCNHPQKFPHPQLLLMHYLQGSTALEAYWKSVAWPRQGLFVGDPLAAPFARMRP